MNLIETVARLVAAAHEAVQLERAAAVVIALSFAIWGLGSL